jgi:hypothetical protein
MSTEEIITPGELEKRIINTLLNGDFDWQYNYDNHPPLRIEELALETTHNFVNLTREFNGVAYKYKFMVHNKNYYPICVIEQHGESPLYADIITIFKNAVNKLCIFTEDELVGVKVENSKLNKLNS